MYLGDESMQTSWEDDQENIGFVRTFPDTVTVSPERVTFKTEWIHVPWPPYRLDARITRPNLFFAQPPWRRSLGGRKKFSENTINTTIVSVVVVLLLG